MVMNCEQVWREISNYLDGELDTEIRAAVDEHLRGCKNCAAVVDGTRNVVQLFGDERMVEIPLGFDHRLHRRLHENMHPTRRTFFGWMVAAAAAILVAGTFELGRSSALRRAQLRSEHAESSSAVPPDMMVLVYPEGKSFHVAGCTFIHDKTNLKSITASEATKEGYTPCVRCMQKYLTQAPEKRSVDLHFDV